jgi:hypothetical protein
VLPPPLLSFTKMDRLASQEWESLLFGLRGAEKLFGGYRKPPQSSILLDYCRV